MAAREAFRRAIINIGMVCCSITDGFLFGQMSGMVADMRSPQSDIYLTDDHISWIAATINGTCMLGFILTTIITEKLGPKRTISLFAFVLILNWIVVYLAHDFVIFMLTRVVVGICYGGVILLSCICTAEYALMDDRGFYMNLVTSVGPAIGTALGHILGTLLHWRIVALIGIIPTAAAAILPLFWVESPMWLASKGKFEECEIAFKALHGDGAEDELQQLKQAAKLIQTRTTEQSTLKKFLVEIYGKRFWKITALIVVIFIYKAAAFKVLFNTLAVTMLQDITKSSQILMFVLLVDGFAIFGSCLACLFIRVMKLRTLLFSTGIIANVFLIILSVCLYFQPDNDIYFSWFNSSLLALYFITVNAGPYPVLETLTSELFPLEFKGWYVVVLGIPCSLIFFISLKMSSVLFVSLGYHGFFVLNAGIVLFCQIYLWIWLPETKGKTLQEIEAHFNNEKSKKDKVVNSEQFKRLV